MAHMENTGREELPQIINLDMAVGKEPLSGLTQPNRRDDVMLTQYLLRGIYSNPTAFNPPLSTPNGDLIKVDGFYGQQTQKWINHFQIESRNRGNNIATDGIVDRATKGTQISSMSKTAYSIVLMNFAFRRAQPQFFPNIKLDPNCPPELKLATSHVIDSPS